MTRRLSIALLLFGASCGWRFGLEGPDRQVTIGVEIFEIDRTVLERGLEAPLQRALSQAVSDWVDARLVSPERADWVIRGRILGFRRRSGIRSTSHELLESGVRLDVSAELVERATGRLVAPSARESIWSGFALDAAANESAAVDRGLRAVAEALVLDLFRQAPHVDPASESTRKEATSGR
jgi:hypothetical protein